MPSLTVEEARARSAAIRVLSMDVELDLTRGDEVFDSASTIEVEVGTGTDTFLDVQPRALHAVTLDGASLDVSRLVDGRYPLSLDAGRHTVTVRAQMAYSHDGEGLHRTVDPADGRPYTYLMSFLDAAPRCFACFDQPDLKAPYAVRVVAPENWTVVGNGRATRAGSSGSGTVWQLAETRPLATYFVTLVAGPYASRLGEHDGIRLGVHAKQSLSAALDHELDEILEVTAQGLDRFHALFGIRYPFGDYHQAFVPEFNAGAMENPGCVTFRDSLLFRGPVTTGERGFRAEIIVHEMAHMWFGDLVTMRWWDDLWLNESFADYMGFRVTDEATRFDDLWVETAFRRKHWGLRADQRPSTHPVAGNGVADAGTALQDFDGISYAKGAAVLRQLATHLGDETFLAGVRDHLEAHAYANATLGDLLAAWERAGASDIAAWAQAWLRQAGADTLRVEGSELVREPPVGAGDAPRPHRLTVQRVGPSGAVAAEPLLVDAARTPLPLAPEHGHLLLPDAHDQTWAKVRFDAETLALLPDRLPLLADPVSRGAVWLALRDAFEDAELAPDVAMRLLGSALPVEDQDHGVEALATFGTVDVVGRALGGEAGARAAVAAALDARLASAPAGSSLQLAAARAVARATDDVERLARWLAGEHPEGLVLDADLRWRVLHQLCRLGAAAESEIAAEAGRDRSHEGEQHAARCRASVPDPAAKAAVWDLITRDDTVSNHVLYASCEGFWWPEQQGLLEEYVPRYFAELPATIALRQGWVVAESVREAYPRYAVAPGPLAAADAAIAADGLDPSVRRALVDSTDELRRALAVRTRWPA